MAITSISRMQQRRGARDDLPQALAEGEFGWCLDTRELFIGNGPGFGFNTPVLTQYSENTNLIATRFGTSDTTLTVSVVRSLGQKLNDMASIKDLGAKGNGLDDDAPAINAAIQQLLGRPTIPTNADVSLRVVLRFPAGTYRLSQRLLLYPYLVLIGDGMDRTILLADDGFLPTSMMTTADNLGQTYANIGLGGARLPSKILIGNMTISTNGLKIDACDMVRYQGIRFESVRFIGGYSTGDLLTDAHAAVRLRSIGSATSTIDAQFVDCDFGEFTHGVLSDDPVRYTRLSRCWFNTMHSGLRLGFDYLSTGSNGPSYTSVTQSIFDTIDSGAIQLYGPNPGVASMNNTFKSCGSYTSSHPIYWNTGTSLCSSIADVFDTALKISDLGFDNVILGPQVQNIHVLPAPINGQTSSYVAQPSDAGKIISITTGGVTINQSTFPPGTVFSIYNDSAIGQTITQGTGVTLRLGGTSTTGNRTVDDHGLVHVTCVKHNEFVLQGSGLS